MRTLFGSLSLSFVAAAAAGFPLVACSGGTTDGPGAGCVPTALDQNCDLVEDDLGVRVGNDSAYQVDINGDGSPDGSGYDTDGNGLIDAIDTDGDGFADTNANGPINPGGGSGGSGPGNTGGMTGGGGVPSGGSGPGNTGGVPGNTGGVPANTGGTPITGGGGTAPNTGGSGQQGGNCLSNTPMHSAGRTVGGSNDSVRYLKVDTTRNGVNYQFIANGWGPKWQSHDLTYEGSRFSVDDFQGQRGDGYEPAGYPTVFCGKYSDSQSKECGLPASVNSLSEIDTGLRWSHSGTGSDFNVAYDIWMGNGNNFSSYLMVWYRDPPQNQPAGSIKQNNVMVAGESWDLWDGQVNNSPIVNYVRPQGRDINELSFDAMDYVDHAQSNYNLPGDTVLSVAIGFEIWSGPVTNLSVEDFCVNVK